MLLVFTVFQIYGNQNKRLLLNTNKDGLLIQNEKKLKSHVYSECTSQDLSSDMLLNTI